MTESTVPKTPTPGNDRISGAERAENTDSTDRDQSKRDIEAELAKIDAIAFAMGGR